MMVARSGMYEEMKMNWGFLAEAFSRASCAEKSCAPCT